MQLVVVGRLRERLYRSAIYMLVNAGIPLLLMAYHIYGAHWIELEQVVDPKTGVPSVNWTWIAENAPYPAHELYINQEPIFLLDPIPRGLTPLALCGSRLYESGSGTIRTSP